jgi:flavorubredoxin
MATILFEQDNHRCIAFNDLVRGEDGIQANQFLIQHGSYSALLDPGGQLLYNPLILALSAYQQPADLTWLLCSHQDPDIIGSVDKWLLYSRTTVVCSKLWGRFVPHLVPGYMANKGSERYLLLPDEGGRIGMGDAHLQALPAHFLHSVGNFSFYDPTSRILFSGDIGSSMVPSNAPYAFAEDFRAHKSHMEGFHRRYMASNRAARLWVQMVRSVSPQMIVPQHGLPMRGETMHQFLDWLVQLECGVDLLGPMSYAA